MTSFFLRNRQIVHARSISDAGRAGDQSQVKSPGGFFAGFHFYDNRVHQALRTNLEFRAGVLELLQSDSLIDPFDGSRLGEANNL